jgi:hypothetical protein
VNKVCSKYIITKFYKKGKEDRKFGSKNKNYLFGGKGAIHIKKKNGVKNGCLRSMGSLTTNLPVFRTHDCYVE